jgi:hypothetical protein
MTDTPVKETKTPRQRFVDVGVARTQRAIDAIELVGNCATPASYEYSPEEATAILDALREAVSKVGDRFFSNQPEKPKFTLPKGE